MLKKIPVFIFLLLHFAFLWACIVHNLKNIPGLMLLVSIAVLLAMFYNRKSEAQGSNFRKRDVLLIVLTAAGTFITYYLNQELEMGSVLAAGLVGFVAAFLPFFNRKSDFLREIPVGIYCGSFAGMTAPFVLNSYSFILVAGIFTGLLLIISKSTLQGFGGKLGTIAFGGVSLMSLLIFLFE